MDCVKIESGTSLLRVFHAAPQAPAVDVYINEKLVFSNLQFTQFSSYVKLKEGEYRIDIFQTGTMVQPIISGSLDLDEGQMLTIAAIGNLDDLSLLVINDNADKKASPKVSSFRVVHLSPNTPAVDILVNNKILVENLAFKQNTSYVDIAPGSYNIEAVLNSNKESVLVFGAMLKANRIYTIYIVGESPNLRAIQSVDGNTYLCRYQILVSIGNYIMKCSRRKALKEEISNDWNKLNLAAQILVLVGGFIFIATVFLAFYKISDDSLYKSVETVFRSCLSSIFGFILSSNIKNTDTKAVNKISYNENEEILITQEEEECIKNVNYQEGNSIQLIVAFVICMVCSISILAIYIRNLNQDIHLITQFRDLMCTSIGFLLGESKIKK